MFYKFYKPTTVFANKTVRSLQRELNASKIGHIGILDPLAEGLMIVATDFETKLLQYVDNKNKSYIAKVKFGYFSDTYDSDGVVEKSNESAITESELLNAIEYISQTTTQIPPIFSAKKINGKKAYEYARNNEEIELKAQNIKIFTYKLLEFDYQKQEAQVYLEVSEGTYIRTILVDTAKYCNKHAIMTALKRTQVGNVKLDNLKENEYAPIAISDIISLPILILKNENIKAIEHGNSFKIVTADGMYLLKNPANNLICAIGQVTNNIFQPKKVALERI
ncbi:tRNA pseudouridine(55) synthase TruB [Mycoplasma sp. 005V]|uniref:tRNA pseudouridine(55) synthase TruB n=1 Tax=unclassified Mycoplasma TaxID=2683645 RepID=UPI003A88E6BD